jgi:spermidine/putrescine transport system substrate-binding protein
MPFPRKEANLWFDAMAIPKTSKNKEAAEKFINFMTSPEIACAILNILDIPHRMLQPGKCWMMRFAMMRWHTRIWIPWISEVFEDVSDIIEVYNRIWDEIKAQ